MTGFITVVVREVNERKAVLWAAVLAAIVPILLPLFPGFASYTASEVRGATAWVTALLLAWIMAFFFGSSMVASELFEGRLGFYYSRPLHPMSMWFGKLCANFALVVAAELLVLLPTALMASSRHHFVFGGWELWAVAGVVFGVPLLILLVVHSAAVMERTRTVWVGVDAALLIVFGFAIWAVLPPLFLPAPRAFGWAVAFVLVGAILALIGAGAAQAALGRTDIRRSHRVLSTVLWGSLAVVALVTASFSWWLFDVGPEDLVSIASVEAAPQGKWVAVEGPTSGRFDLRPRFLLDTESGRHIRLGPGDWMSFLPVAFSGDGGTAAWLQLEGKDQWRLVFVTLGEGGSAPVQSDMFFSQPVGLELDTGGGRVAVLERRVVSVYELETGRLIMAAPIGDDEWVARARWLSDDRIRLYLADGPDLMRAPEVVITEIDLETGKVEDTGVMEAHSDDPGLDGVSNRRWLRFDPPRDRLLEIRRTADGWLWLLRDADTGAVISDLGLRTPSWGSAFLEDGRFAYGVVDDDGAWLEWLDPTGAFEGRTYLGEGTKIVLGGEAQPGVLTLSVDRSDSEDWDLDGWEAVAVDLNDASVREIPGVAWPADWVGIFQTGMLGNGELFLNGEERLVEWDPVTGATRLVL